MVGGVETDAGDEGNNIGYHHMGVDDHLGHPGKGQQNHQIYQHEMEEVKADDKGSSHPGCDGLEGPDTDPMVGVTRAQGYSSPCHRPDLVPQGDTEHNPEVEGMKYFDPHST